MRIKEDARVKKTKMKLFVSFKELITQKSYEDITVNELCAKADIRRATFYKHFVDKYDFLVSMVSAYVRSVDMNMAGSEYKKYPVEYHIEYQRRLVAHLVANEEIVRLISESNMYSHLLSAIVQQNYVIIKERLECSIENGERLIAPTDTVATMLSGGIGAIIAKWFADNKPCSVDDLYVQIENCTRAMFIKQQ